MSAWQLQSLLLVGGRGRGNGRLVWMLGNSKVVKADAALCWFLVRRGGVGEGQLKRYQLGRVVAERNVGFIAFHFHHARLSFPLVRLDGGFLGGGLRFGQFEHITACQCLIDIEHAGRSGSLAYVHSEYRLGRKIRWRELVVGFAPDRMQRFMVPIDCSISSVVSLETFSDMYYR